MSDTRSFRSSENRTQTDTALQLRDVRVWFGMERGEARVLKNVSLDLRHGEILGVVGESGSGKSMLANSILNAVPEPGQTAGEITYYPEDGRDPMDVLSLDDPTLKSVRWKDISMVFQGAMNSFNPTLDIRNHFIETLDAHDVDRETGMERARELLSDFYLEPDLVLGSYAHELSGGMRQRALIALSLVLDPDLLVLDEPTSALDLLMQRTIVSLLEEIRDKYNLTMLFISHDLALVAHLADRMAIMYDFDIVETGPADEVIDNGGHPYTRALLRAVPNLDAPLSEMRPIGGSSPDPVEKIDGCPYHPRCPLADNQCENVEPPLEEIGEEHRAACHYWERARTEIPLGRGGDGR
jgi:oligopeptide/dipeptide ABC transporter ATP-binding protein